jgi:hypothetical protein
MRLANMINMETKNGATNVNGLSKSRYPLNFAERNLAFVYGSFMVNFTDIMTPQYEEL